MRYKYHTRDKYGNVHLSTSDYSLAWGSAENNNFELLETLPSIRIGKKKIDGRVKILRKITNQPDFFKHTELENPTTGIEL